MSSLTNIQAYIASDPSMPLQVKKTLLKCFNELSYAVNLPVSVTDGGTGTDLSATGGTSEVLLQENPGDPITVRQLAVADISDFYTSLAANTVTYDPLVVNTSGGVYNESVTAWPIAYISIDATGTITGNLQVSPVPFPDQGGQNVVHISFLKDADDITWPVAYSTTTGLSLPASAVSGDTLTFACDGLNWIRIA